MTEQTILVARKGNVAWVTLNRPERRNAINAELMHALSGAIQELERDHGISVIVMKGAGKVFSAGMDLAAFGEGHGDDILFAEGGLLPFVRRERRTPIIAAVHGAAVAGGFELAMAADLIVAEEGALFGLPEVKRGLVAGAGGALRLASLIPPGRAREILLTGRLFHASEAWDMGLLARLSPEGQAEATAADLAEQIAANAPEAVVQTLRLSRYADPTVAHWDENVRVLHDILVSEDAAEGARAFVEKREPHWQGR